MIGLQVAEKGPEPVYQLVGGRTILIHLQYAAKQAGEGRGKDEIAERVGDEERGGGGGEGMKKGEGVERRG